eukprot:TRINITY_DN949_c0_g2_i6.p1 TRINITY_DN949_c0_g2~~TRINITY_DN949_c0_g2_i6.p1  ORF type:complete len:452 (-),score=66.66 TRINITY_DN949_c0_g2_i6:16-1371(-)
MMFHFALLSFIVWAVTADVNSDIAKEVLSVLDLSVDPCNDFWTYACGGWLKNTTLPPTKSALFRSFSFIGDNNQDLLRQVVDNPAKVKVYTFYNSCMNMDAINSAGLSPANSDLEFIESVEDSVSFMKVVGTLYLKGITSLFSFGPTIDPGNPSAVIGSFDQGGLGLPTGSMYLSPDPDSARIRKEYQTHLERVFTLAKDQDPASSATLVYSLEQTIAGFTIPDDQLTDPFKTYNPMTVEQFQALSPSLSWQEFFNVLNIATMANVTVSVPSFFSNLSQVLPSLQAAWKPYLRWNVLRARSSILSQPFRDENFNFYSKFLGGQDEPTPLWRTCMSVTDQNLGELLGKYYVKLAFPGSSQELTTQLLQDIISAMHGDLQTITWMDDQTRQLALDKLALVIHQLGSPAHPRTYNNVVCLFSFPSGSGFFSFSFCSSSSYFGLFWFTSYFFSSR